MEYGVKSGCGVDSSVPDPDQLGSATFGFPASVIIFKETDPDPSFLQNIMLSN
jgi:hypothetical protein